jgi:hypothetical protein
MKALMLVEYVLFAMVVVLIGGGLYYIAEALV